MVSRVYIKFVFADSQTSTRSRMKKSLLIFVSGFLCNIATCATEKCASYDFVNEFHGRYCPTQGIIAPNVAWHQCKLICLQKSSCQAVNYNFTTHLCTYFTATCQQAGDHRNMIFVLFTRRQAEQCMQWIPVEDGEPTQDRSVTKDNVRFVARMQKDGNDFISNLNIQRGYCISRHEESEFQSRDGYPCQYLRIQDGCTVYFISYELGTPLPHNALIGAYTAEGLPVYIGRKGVKPGYYIPGSGALVINTGNAIANVKMLVLL